MKLWQKLKFPRPKSEASAGKLSLKENEIYSGIELPTRPQYFVARLDGWGFHSLAKQIKLKKPFDRWFMASLAEIAKNFFIPFNVAFAYIFSDEINLLFTKPTSFRRIEKIDSIFASIASSAFTNLLQKKFKKQKHFAAAFAAFDCRCIPLEKKDIIPYFIWRQAEAFRNSNNSYAQHILLKKKKSPRGVSKELEGMKTAQLRTLINKHIGLKKIPGWHERGIGLYKQAYTKKGYNPLLKRHVTVQRFKVIEDWNLPIFASKQGKKLLKRFIQ